MATAPQTLLTLEEFDARYGSEPGWEYWFGEAVRKPVPTWYHGVLQVVLANLLLEAGYFSGSEIDLKVDPRWQPRPDVLKCRLYQRPPLPAFKTTGDMRRRSGKGRRDHGRSGPGRTQIRRGLS